MTRSLLVAYAASATLTAAHPLGMSFAVAAAWSFAVAIFVLVVTTPRKA